MTRGLIVTIDCISPGFSPSWSHRSKRRANVCLLTIYYRDSTLDKYLPPLRNGKDMLRVQPNRDAVCPYHHPVISGKHDAQVGSVGRIRQVMCVHPLLLRIHPAPYWRGACEKDVCLVKNSVHASLTPQYYRTSGNPTAASSSGLVQTLASYYLCTHISWHPF